MNTSRTVVSVAAISTTAASFIIIVGSSVGENVGQGVEGVGVGAFVGASVGALESVGDTVGALVGDVLGAAVSLAARQTIPSPVTKSPLWRFGSRIGPSCRTASVVMPSALASAETL